MRGNIKLERRIAVAFKSPLGNRDTCAEALNEAEYMHCFGEIWVAIVDDARGAKIIDIHTAIVSYLYAKRSLHKIRSPQMNCSCSHLGLASFKQCDGPLYRGQLCDPFGNCIRACSIRVNFLSKRGVCDLPVR